MDNPQCQVWPGMIKSHQFSGSFLSVEPCQQSEEPRAPADPFCSLSCPHTGRTQPLGLCASALFINQSRNAALSSLLSQFLPSSFNPFFIFTHLCCSCFFSFAPTQTRVQGVVIWTRALIAEHIVNTRTRRWSAAITDAWRLFMFDGPVVEEFQGKNTHTHTGNMTFRRSAKM